jgi:protein gp37
MKASAIGWTDYSGGDLNFVSGCTPVSEGCQHCYARAIARRFGRNFDAVVYDEDKVLRAARRDYGHSPKRGLGRKPMCFVCDTGDFFHEDVPIHFLQLAWQSMAYRDDVIWQVLTKRPERALDFFNAYGYQYQLGGEPHIWLGVTTETQRTADERIPILLDIPAAVRFVSVEPMLGPVDVRKHLGGDGLSWVICGAESGPNRRPFEAAWAEALYQQCKKAGTPFFAKQCSAHRPGAPLVLSDGIVQQWPGG